MPPAAKKKKSAPLCARCKNHGIQSEVKGHKRHCKFKDCMCFLCTLTKEHQKVVAAQVKTKRQQEQDQNLGIPITPSPPEPAGPPAGLTGTTTNSSNLGLGASVEHHDFDELVELSRQQPSLVAQTLIQQYGTAEQVISMLQRLQMTNTISSYAPSIPAMQPMPPAVPTMPSMMYPPAPLHSMPQSLHTGLHTSIPHGAPLPPM